MSSLVADRPGARRLPAPTRGGRRRAARPGHPVLRPALLAVAVVAALGLPWLLPSLPSLLATSVPGGVVAQVRDTTTPSSAAPSAPVAAAEAAPDRAPGLAVLRGRLPQAGAPRSVEVSRLSVDSRVVPISGQSGTLLPPSDARVLGWWQEGAVPGAAHGTAVLTGHTVHTGGGALDHLGLLVPGDTVRVATAEGRIRYAVRSVEVLTKAALAAQATDLFRLAGPGRLVLITCSDWDGSGYRTNTVVVARPVGPVADRAADTASGYRAPAV